MSRGNEVGISEPNWLPTTPLEEMSKTRYDVLIVGTGAGGGAVLWRLCEHWKNAGKKIGVIEAGDLILPTNIRNVETMNSQRVNELSYGKRGLVIEVPGTNFREIIAVGGRTLAWNAYSPRMHIEPNEWPFPLHEMEQYYRIAEQAMGVSVSYMAGSPIQQLFLNRLWNSGFSRAQNMPMAADLEPTKYGELHSNVYFSSVKFLARALFARAFDLAVLSRAVGIIANNGKVEGIEAMTIDRKSYTVKADNVVLCTSSVETPRLLLHSGIPGPAIGHYLTKHTVVWSPFKLNREQYPYVTGTAGILLPEQEGFPLQIQVDGPSRAVYYHNKFIPFESEEQVNVAGIGIVQPRFENYVSLNPLKQDRYGVPEVRIQMTYSPYDYAVTALAEQLIGRVVSALGLETTAAFNRDAPLQGDHESGTCRMGVDPVTTATNRFGQIHGIGGLFVADNSVIPMLKAANPTLTTVALALRTADYIALTT
ncbi:GMC oxidoreductase [Paenibacillus vietnamensis]|uniref:GMC oxidoreductase n=1 Tax=Paenibacillus vietnamensis TaxID=2590547 RepID=UPI001CD13CBB|nr:GMC oxidoreductase [Paenibacillus vietnamensis]